MANVTYLIGAGASAGKRGDNGYIIEGLPCVNEISSSIRDICNLIDQTPIPDYVEKWEDTQLELNSKADWDNARKKLLLSFQRLLVHSERHATIDTYAKKLVLKNNQIEFKQLEQLLTLFFIFLQVQNSPDSRYDTFLANILESNLHFPLNIRVLSWNYDSQFELAYSGYDTVNELLVGYKNAMFDMDYEIIKINGTATFSNQENISKLRKEIWNRIWEISEDTRGSIQLQRDQAWLVEFVYLYQLYVYGRTNNTHLSFAFDNTCPSNKIMTSIDNIIRRTDALVIIGYTFPFFNRKIDRQILQGLEDGVKIYIQDPYPERIRQSLKAVLPDVIDENITTLSQVDQFFLPPEL